MTKVINFFVKNTKFKQEEIVKVEHIQNGFTNDIFHIILNDNKHFKIRFASNNKYINRELEKKIEFDLYKDDILYYDNDGNFIKKWYIGNTLEKDDLSNEIFLKITNFINRFQNLDVENINVSKPVYVLHDHNVEQRLIKPLLAYKKIINEDVKTNNDVLCHNDLSCNNTIVTKNDLIIMDFEWSTYNHPYWDIANLIKDLELTFEELIQFNFINDYDFDLLLKIIYATHFYTYYWTLKVEETNKIIEYRNSVIKQIIYWYNILRDRKILHA